MIERKAQSGVVTAVILAGIMVAGISSAYTWGLPLLQKQQDTDKLESSLQKMNNIAGEIRKAARRGGSSTIEFDLGEGFLDINVSDNSISYSTVTSAAYVSPDSWVPLNENDMNGIKEAGLGGKAGTQGKDKPGVIIGKADLQGDEYKTTYKLKYRQLRDPSAGKAYLIQLERDGNLNAAGGEKKITIEKGGEEVIEGGGVTGEPLVVRKVLVRIS